jgi:hypothetical protein
MRVAAVSLLFVSTAFGCVLAVFGCSASGGDNEFGAGGGGGEASGGPTQSNGAGIGGEFSSGASMTGGGPNCGEAAKLVYVLSDANELYSFDPPGKKFTKIGTLGCQTSMQPNSMAIDRDATAWVNYVEGDFGGDTAGAIFKVSTVDASCQPTSISLGVGWYRLGMGFSTDTSDGTSETLFVAGTADPLGGSSPGLGRIDFKAGTVVPIGSFTGQLNGENAELTGTGDAKLFGFFTTTPVQVAEIDKMSGAILSSKSLPTVETPFAWAFSFWGGDFYLYTAPDQLSDPTRTTNVTHYTPADGNADIAYMKNIGFRIVGAGVSTCAPVEPPK